MPLSDREKRLLEEMEAALLTEDPRLVSALSASGPIAPSRKRIMAGLALLAVGLITLFTGLISQLTPVGVFGFLICLTGVLITISSISPMVRGPQRRSPRSNISARLEKRWDNRGQEQ